MRWRDRLVTISVLVWMSIVVVLVFFLVVLVTQPYQAWFRDLRIFGLCFNVAGALTSVIPRALRDQKDIEALAGTFWDGNPHLKAFLLRETRVAQSGMVIFCIGFALQLLGNVG